VKTQDLRILPDVYRCVMLPPSPMKKENKSYDSNDLNITVDRDSRTRQVQVMKPSTPTKSDEKKNVFTETKREIKRIVYDLGDNKTDEFVLYQDEEVQDDELANTYEEHYKKHLSKLASKRKVSTTTEVAQKEQVDETSEKRANALKFLEDLCHQESLESSEGPPKKMRTNVKLNPTRHVTSTKQTLKTEGVRNISRTKALRFISGLSEHYHSLSLKEKKAEFLVQNKICYFHAYYGTSAKNCKKHQCTFAQYL